MSHLRAADQDPSALPTFLDGVLNSNTGFFRHPGAMNALARQVIPQLYARKSDDGPSTLRIWSAGCSTGEEAYSIAMALCEALPAVATAMARATAMRSSNGNGERQRCERKNRPAATAGLRETSVPGSRRMTAKDWSIHIVGSDLLPSAIEVAERGLYPQSALTGLPPAAIRACFSKIGSPNASSNGSSEGSQNAGTNGSSNGSSERLNEWLRKWIGECFVQRRASAGEAPPA